MTETIKTIPELTARNADAHKGDFGKVLVVAGSRGMAGAASLVASAALRSGAGLVRVATAQSGQLTVEKSKSCAS